MNKNSTDGARKSISLKAQILGLIAGSFAVALVTAAVLFRIYSDRQVAKRYENIGLHMATLSQYQANQILPALLIDEQYNGIEMQLEQIRGQEQLTDVRFDRGKEPAVSSTTVCTDSVNKTGICLDRERQTVTTSTPLVFDSRTYGRLVKIKKIDQGEDAGSRAWEPVVFVALALLVAFLTIVMWMSVFLDRHIRKPLLSLESSLDPVLSEAGGQPLERFRVAEINAVVEQIQKLITKYQDRRSRAVAGEISQQVAHDIRSPLAALEMISSHLEDLPEDRRLLLRHAIGRIRDIANNLLERKGLDKASLHERPLSVELLPALVGSLISEKREQYRGRPGIEIEAAPSTGEYGLFSCVQPVDLSRVLSNLINNAVEAMEGSGRVIVRLICDEDTTVRIEVADTGKGIPPKVLPRLMQRGATHGKTNGSGLGLAHARESLENWGGSIQIASQLGVGTTVTLRLPRASTPAWFTERLEVSRDAPVVVVDDDPSIHEIWNRRLSESGGRNPLEIVHIYSGDALRDWVQSNTDKALRACFLADYELEFDGSSGCPTLGLNVLLDLGLSQRSILVTSRADEPELRRRCERERVRMMPKGMAPFIPIVIQTPREPWDALLIDDDPLVRMSWNLSAKRQGLKFQAFADSHSFFEAAEGIHIASSIYVDVHLNEGRNGIETVRDLQALGFERVFLATGSDAKLITDLPPGLCGVIGKEPPWTATQTQQA